METLREKRARVAEILRKLSSAYPDARLELEFSNPWSF
jgi:hypothetical protein